MSNLAKVEYFTNMDFPEITGCPFLSFWGEVVWGRFWPETSLSPESEFAQPVLVVHVWLPSRIPRFRQNKRALRFRVLAPNACIPWLGSISYPKLYHINKFQCANTPLDDKSLCSKSGDNKVLVGTLLTSTCHPSLFYGSGKLQLVFKDPILDHAGGRVPHGRTSNQQFDDM